MPYYEYDKDYPFAAFITNLGKYNEGELVGEWLKFPTTYDELQAVFKRIGIGSKDEFGQVYEEWFITDYDCYVDGLYDKLGEYANLDELNYLASKLDEMSQDEYERFQAAVSMGEYTGSIQDLINLTENPDIYDVYPGIRDHDDLGRYYIEEMGAMEVPEYLQNYIDYEAYGRDVAMEENGDFTDFGYVRHTGDRFYEEYDGDRDSIPEEYRVMSSPDGEELTEDEKSEMAMDIAFSMDEFFRQNDPAYAAQHPEDFPQKEAIYESLMAGKIAALQEKLEDMGQTERDPIMIDLAEFKEAIGYDDFLDVDPAAIRAALENPDKSHIDAMLAAAEAAERDYVKSLDNPHQLSPDEYVTGERIETPRGSFHLTDLTREQMEASGYGVHHTSPDNRYLIMGNGTRAFAVQTEQTREASVLAEKVDNALREYTSEHEALSGDGFDIKKHILDTILEGDTAVIKTEFINLGREKGLAEQTAPLIASLDEYERAHGVKTYMVYQLKPWDDLRDYRFEPLERLHEAGLEVSHINYELVFARKLTPGDTPETIFYDLNMERPEHFHGHSLSVSDVVILRENGRDTPYYCDSAGFTEVPQFWKDNPLRTAEMTLEDDYGMIDGVINNGRRGEETEKAKEHTSIHDRLAAAKQECAQRKPPEPKQPGRNTPGLDEL